MGKPLYFLRKPIVAGTIVFVTLLLLSQLFTYQRYVLVNNHRTRELTNAANLVKEKIESALSNGSAAAITLNIMVKNYGVADFDKISKHILELNKNIDGLSLVKGETVTHIYPLTGNEAYLGHNIFKDTVSNKQVLKSLNKREFYFAGPYVLRQGGRGIIGRTPIFIDGRYYGFATSLIKLSTFLKVAQLDSPYNPNYSFQISKIDPTTHNEVFFLPNGESFNKRGAVLIKIPQGDWNIYAQFTSRPTYSSLYAPIILGFLLALVAGILSYYLAKRPIELRKLVAEKIKLLQESEKELVQSEEKFRTLVEQSLTGVFIYQDDSFIYVNPAFEKTSGYTKHELVYKMSLEELVHHDYKKMMSKNHVARISQQALSDHYIVKFLSKEGILRHIEMVVSTISYNDNPAIIGTIIDVTERLEEEKRIDRAVTQAQERERLEIGMELHDNVKQLLAASKFALDILPGVYDQREAALKLIDDVKTNTAEAIQELRRLSHQLAPSLDPHSSLTDKISALAESMNLEGKLRISIAVEESDKSLKEEIQLALYRIVQEQLVNIIKYAEASHVEIRITLTNSGVHMKIADDGKGYDTNEKKPGIGLENIKRRARFLDGTANVSSTPGNGCTINVNIPLAETMTVHP